MLCYARNSESGRKKSCGNQRRLVNGYSRVLMVVQRFPLILALIPRFIIFKTAGLVNTYWSVILVYMVLNLPS